jgi:opacity protein-like surface antigen
MANENKTENVNTTSAQKVTTNSKKRVKNSAFSNLGLTFSMGPDLSFVGMNKPGKFTMSYGAGLSYKLAKRLTVQSGFYVSRKLYSSDSASYNPSGPFWTFYPNMQNINADCKVYEIPVKLSYSFGEKGKHNWIAGAGISSYLMKEETYRYEYKTSAGQNTSRSYTISNTNKHYFSVLSLNGGYQYNFNKRVSVSAEPYIKLPLTGIGFGKVKLKGTGMLFTATIKPFAKKK